MKLNLTRKSVPLTCSSLENEEKVHRAEMAVRKLLVVAGNIGETVESEGQVLLPSTQDIMKALSGLETQIKRRRSETNQIQREISIVEEKEEHEREQNEREKKEKEQEEEEKRIATKIKQLAEEKRHTEELIIRKELEEKRELKQKKEEEKRLKESQEKQRQRDIMRIEHQKEATVSRDAVLSLSKQLDERKINVLAQMEKACVDEVNNVTQGCEKQMDKAMLQVEETKKMVEQMDTSFKDLQAKIIKTTVGANDEKLLAENLAKQSIEESSNLAQDRMDQDQSEYSLNIFSQLSSRLITLLQHTKDEPEEMKSLVSSIQKKNLKCANESHFESLSSIPYTPIPENGNITSNLSPPCLVSEQHVSEDEIMEKSNEKWAHMTREISGPGDALFSELTEIPYFKEHMKNHKSLKLLVSEHVKAKNQKLFKRWEILGHEYTLRQQLYSNKDADKKLRSTKIDCIKAPNFKKELTSDSRSDVGTSRVGTNAYRRTRRGAFGSSQTSASDIVRSEYEQEQIIAELTAKDALEKRITQGASKLPRQRCQIEKVSVELNYFKLINGQTYTLITYQSFTS